MTQIKELLRIGLFVIIVLCGTSACSNDDSDDDELAKDYILMKSKSLSKRYQVS